MKITVFFNNLTNSLVIDNVAKVADTLKNSSFIEVDTNDNKSYVLKAENILYYMIDKN